VPQGKRRRRILRELAGLAYERELRKALLDLHDQFHDWLKDRTDAFELSDAIPAFHDGAARDLYVFYTRGRPEMQVARAVAHGVLRRDEVPGPIIDKLKSLIEFFEEDSAGGFEDDAV
jgi:hypothetical protein